MHIRFAVYVCASMYAYACNCVCQLCVRVRVCCMYIPVCRCSFVCLYVAALLYMYRHLISWLFLFVFIGYMAHHTLYTEA